MHRLLDFVILIVMGSALAVAQVAPAGSVPSNAMTSTSPTVNSTPAAQPQTYDPLLDLPPLPRSKVALLGGTVISVDEVLNRISLRPFGAGRDLHMGFDVRSKIYQDGKSATPQDLKPGEHVYVDSILVGTRIFAKAINIRTPSSSGIGRGQILGYDSATQVLTLRDELVDEEVHFGVTKSTTIRNGGAAGSLADLKPGALVSVDFGISQGKAVASDISVLAETGAQFLFVGKITFLDLGRKMIVVNNQSDGKVYEIHLLSITSDLIRDLHEGSTVTVSAVFNGREYVASNLTPVSTNPQPEP